MSGRLISKICPFFMVPVDSPVNEERYLGSRTNPGHIYENGSGKFIYPVIKLGDKQVHLDKLCLVDFKGDTIYKCFELQQVTQGMDTHYLVLSYRKDNETDIYHTKGFKGEEEGYKSLLNKVTLMELDSIKVKFEVAESGADIWFSFVDKENRAIEIKIKENKERNDSFGLIAPVGNASEAPDKFPVIYLKKVNMVQMKGTEIFVKINGEDMEPIKLVPLCNFKRAYLSRYAYAINIKELNNDFEGVLEPVEADGSSEEIPVDNCIYSINMNSGHPEIESVRAAEPGSEMRISFSPPIPDIVSLKDNIEIRGRFSLSVDEIKGIMGGVYSLKKTGVSVNIKMNPRKGWQPMPGRLWMKTYLWDCDMKLLQGSCQVKTRWYRNGMNTAYYKLKEE
ncbi:MAG: hypothetical protein Q8930_01780 [Bacillota bacterium]|nr:hypothetical protein [Bacillota bacterium]